jgi:hypothetical protein
MRASCDSSAASEMGADEGVCRVGLPLGRLTAAEVDEPSAAVAVGRLTVEGAALPAADSPRGRLTADDPETPEPGRPRGRLMGVATISATLRASLRSPSRVKVIWTSSPGWSAPCSVPPVRTNTCGAGRSTASRVMEASETAVTLPRCWKVFAEVCERANGVSRRRASRMPGGAELALIPIACSPRAGVAWTIVSSGVGRGGRTDLSQKQKQPQIPSGDDNQRVTTTARTTAGPSTKALAIKPREP